MTIEDTKKKIERMHKEAQFKTLATKVANYWDYTPEDRRELWEAFKIDPEGILAAVRQQAEEIEVRVKLGKRPNE
jgi:hypothetical protein